MTPYAPPRSDLATNATLDVDPKSPLPPVCLKCAAKTDVAPRNEALQVVTRRVRFLALGIGAAAGLSMVVIESIQIRAAAIIFLFVAARGIQAILRRVFPKVELGLPLCRTCNERWTVGMRRRKIYRALSFASASVMLGLFALGMPFIGILFFFPSLGFLVANALIRIRSRVIVATDRRGDVVTLSLVHPDAVAKIRAS